MNRHFSKSPKTSKLVFLASSLFSIHAFATPPTQIIFNNETPLDLATAIAGLPGNGIAPSTTRPVSYNIVLLGCNYSGRANHCPIEFTDKRTGDKVATVYINAETATLTQPPLFYGTYAQKYEVSGWEASPLSNISIIEKKFV